MSVRIMTMAWAVDLTPSLKLVLMALADIANDEGICWPSVRLLAKRCSLSDRSVRAILRNLESRRLILIERRFRGDGSQASNRYKVLPKGVDETALGGGEAASGGEGGTTGDSELEQGGPDAECSPSNHQQDPSNESQQPPDRGGEIDLVFPRRLNAAERAEAAKRLREVDVSKAQEILFELDARMKQKEVKNPLGYLRALIVSAKSGGFNPELAQKAREAHEREVAIAAELAHADSVRNATASSIDLDALSPRLRNVLQKHVRPAAASAPPAQEAK